MHLATPEPLSSPAFFARPRRSQKVRPGRREEPAGRPAEGALAGRSALGRVGRGWAIVVAALATFLFHLSARLATPDPWSYDEYYHLGVARELVHHFPLRAFPWTPFSILADHYADKEILFHLLLMPFAGLPIATAGTLGVALGQIFLVAAFAWTLWHLRVPFAPGLVLGLAALGPLFAYRISMCRPHVFMVGFSLLVLGFLLGGERRGWRGWKTGLPLFLVAALFGVTHTAGWVSIAFALIYAAAGWLAVGEERRFLGVPLAWTAGGWLAGQILHPNFPENFRLLWLQNAVVPFQSAGGGSAALAAVAGAELTRPSLALLLEQWPAFLAPLFALYLLLRDRELRTRSTVTVEILALAFLAAGSLAFQRLLEVGAPLGLLALALVTAERRAADRPSRGGWGPWIAVLVLGIGAVWTFTLVRERGFGSSYPQEMARWLGEHGEKGARVFTAQWGDSAPLLYFAPQLQSLVALDPTFFLVKDPALFNQYVEIALGRNPDPVPAIRQRFGARYITVWRAPVYGALAAQLGHDPRARLLYRDSYYLIWELSSP